MPAVILVYLYYFLQKWHLG